MAFGEPVQSHWLFEQSEDLILTIAFGCCLPQMVPEGDWYCPNCRCASCGESQFDGDKSTFNDLTVILCDQCECECKISRFLKVAVEVFVVVGACGEDTQSTRFGRRKVQ